MLLKKSSVKLCGSAPLCETGGIAEKEKKMKVSIACGLLALPALAQFTPDTMMKPYAYTNEAREVFTCQVSAPQFPVEGKRYPLILFLHGSGECGTNNYNQIKVGLPTLLTSLVKRPEQVIVVAPQCQPLNLWVKSLARTSDYAMSQDPMPSMEVALELCQHFVRERQADSNRLYITGLSLGGFGTWDAIQRYPKMFAAAMPICGGGDVRRVRDIKATPIWVFHAKDDTNVAVDCSRRMVKQLKAIGSKRVQYTEFENGGHNSWDRAYSDPKVIDWLLKQTREKQPWWKFWLWFD